MKHAYMKERELIIKLHKDGKKQDQIARILGCSQSKVSFWIIRFNKTGSLKNKPRPGRPSNFSEEKLSLIKSKIVKKVVSRNQKFSSCNSKELRNIINKEVKKPICMRHARRILHKMGFSLITPRSKHTKNDLEKVTKFRKKFKKNLKESFWVIR